MHCGTFDAYLVHRDTPNVPRRVHFRHASAASVRSDRAGRKELNRAPRFAEERGVFDLMTDAARRLVVCARSEAETMGHSHVGTEHLLLASLFDDTYVSAQAVKMIVGESGPMRRALVAVQRAGSSTPTSNAVFTEDAKAALEAAARFAKEMNHSSVGTGHVLVAVLDGMSASWAPVVAALGIEPTEVYDTVVSMHPGSEIAPVHGTVVLDLPTLARELAELRSAVTVLTARLATLERRG